MSTSKYARTKSEANRLYLTPTPDGTPVACPECGAEFHRVLDGHGAPLRFPTHNAGVPAALWRAKRWSNGVVTYLPAIAGPGHCPGSKTRVGLVWQRPAATEDGPKALYDLFRI